MQFPQGIFCYHNKSLYFLSSIFLFIPFFTIHMTYNTYPLCPLPIPLFSLHYSHSGNGFFLKSPPYPGESNSPKYHTAPRQSPRVCELMTPGSQQPFFFKLLHSPFKDSVTKINVDSYSYKKGYIWHFWKKCSEFFFTPQGSFKPQGVIF